MTTPTPPRRLRVAATQNTCTGCGKPMTVYEADQTTHPACDPDVGWPPHGGGRRRDVEQRQLRLVT